MVPYPRFTKLIIDHIFTTYPDIPKILNEPNHLVAEVMQTNAYKVYAADFNLVVPMTQLQPPVSSQGTYRTPSAPRSLNPQITPKKKEESKSGKSSVHRIPLKFKTKKRKQPDLELRKDSKSGSTRVFIGFLGSFKTKKSKQPDLRTPNLNLRARYLLDEDVNQIVEIDKSGANKFVDDMIMSQEYPGTRIDPGSQKESLKALKVVDYVAIDEEEEETAKPELIQRKWKDSLEINDTPLTTPTRSPRIETISTDKDVLKELTALRATSSKVPLPNNGKLLLKKIVEALEDVLPKLVTKATDLNKKHNLPWLVVDAIKLEREKYKAKLSFMISDVADAFLRNYKNTNILHVHLTSSSSSIPDLQHQLYMKTKDDPQAQNVDFAIWIALKYKFDKSSTLVDSCRPDFFFMQDHNDHHDDDSLPEGESSAKRQKIDQETDDDEVPSEEYCYAIVFGMISGSIVWQRRVEDLTLQVLDNPALVYQGCDRNLNAPTRKINYWENGILKALNVFIRSSVTALTLMVPGIEDLSPYSIIAIPFVGLIYKNSKKEKKVMNIDETPKFCVATLEKSVEDVKKINLDVKHGFKDPSLSEEDAEIMKFFEENIQD
ncbi:hypothetical protein Tco_0808635 [Tanacetum coccineum]